MCACELVNEPQLLQLQLGKHFAALFIVSLSIACACSARGRLSAQQFNVWLLFMQPEKQPPLQAALSHQGIVFATMAVPPLLQWQCPPWAVECVTCWCVQWLMACKRLHGVGGSTAARRHQQGQQWLSLGL